MPTAAAYIRVSTEDQMEFSPDSQLRSIQAYALNHHIELLPAHIYLDEGDQRTKYKQTSGFFTDDR